MEYTDNECRHINVLRFDFAIPMKCGKTLLLEYDGQQHFKENMCGWTPYELTHKRDTIKDEFCRKSDKYVLERINYKENVLEKLIHSLQKNKVI